VKHSPEQAMSYASATDRTNSRTNDSDHALRLHPAAGVVCPGCGARIGRPCVTTVPMCGVGAIGAPIEGVHSERIAAAYEQGTA